ncbi:T-cell surface glycoprotein CD3 zeta chain [Nelusetta ayraudi]|uniref:T-cell surface glycoprotein CD3 zeta chain n=1 Tax=Nelusetta ayraudi TaxID=303726 RepID=UPI003F6ED1D3
MGRISGLLVLASLCAPAEAMTMYDPQLCYILDGFLGLYGLFITGLFVREKFFKTKAKPAAATQDAIYTDLKGQDSGDYAPLMKGDPERGRGSSRTDVEYRELPVKRERQRRTDQVYQDLSSATKDTYQSLPMKTMMNR